MCTIPQTDREKLPQSEVTVPARGHCHQVPQTAAEECSALRAATRGAPCLLAPLTIQEGKRRGKRCLGFVPPPPPAKPPRVERPNGQRQQQTNNFKAVQPSLGKWWRLERVQLPQGAWRLGAGWVSTLEPTDLSGYSMRGRGATTDPIRSLGHLHVAAATMDTGGPRGSPGVWLWLRKVWTAAGQRQGCQGAGPGSRDITGHFRCT